ncbi:MAG: hypothetical protein AABY53_01210 [Bdellovibrionota bacterium]
MKTILASLMALSVFITIFFLKSNNSPSTVVALDFKSSMWNGGKPGLPIMIDRVGSNLVVSVHTECESFRVNLRTSDGAQLLSKTQEIIQDCINSKELVIPIQVKSPEDGYGYLIVNVELINGNQAQSISKSFAYQGRSGRVLNTKPTSVDQQGVRYHEFPSISAN